MSSVTFSSAVGGNNSTVTDDADASTGLKNGGHRTLFEAVALAQLVAVAGYEVTTAGGVNTSATNAAVSVTTANNAAGTPSIVTGQSKTIGTGALNLTVTANKTIVVGMPLLVAATGSASNWMLGTVTSYTAGSGALTLDVTRTNGSGTFSNWTVSLSNPSSPLVNVQLFTTAGANTWTKPTGAKYVRVYLVGGGGGGGSGRRADTASSAVTGGGGASGGAYGQWSCLASSLGSTETVTVGAKGTGGAAQTGIANGNDGTDGGTSSFGSLVAVSGGRKGAGGNATGAVYGDFVMGIPPHYGYSTDGCSAGARGGYANPGAGNAAVTFNTFGGGGAGAGAGTVSGTPSSANGGVGGSTGASVSAGTTAGHIHIVTGGSAGLYSGPVAATNGAAAPSDLVMGGGGGGGGYFLINSNGGAGGNGGAYGGGGGGGGAANTVAAQSGKGGDGANGAVLVVAYL